MSSPFTAFCPVRHAVQRISKRINLATLLALLVLTANVYAVDAPLALADAQRRAIERSHQLSAQDFADRFSTTNDFMTMRRVGVMKEVGHASAFAAQVEMEARDEAIQPLSRFDCPPCATCYMGPALTARMTGSGAHPDGNAAFRITQQDESVGSQGVIATNAIRTTIALRILHCRWLN